MTDRDAARENPAVSGDVVARIQIAASRETVWSFFSDGQKFAAWIGSMGGGPPQPGTHVDARVGGAVRVVYPHSPAAAVGKIIEMTPGERVVFSWGYEDAQQGMPAGSTRIEITLSPNSDGGTTVELRHRGIPSEPARRGHLGGWTHYLSMLARQAADAQHNGPLAAALDAYFLAWREADAAARAALLEKCCERGVRVRTSFAVANSIDELSQHIGGALLHMPGVLLEPDGPPQLLHGFACVAWKVAAPGGAAVMKGINYLTLSPVSRFETIVSFPAPAAG